MPVPYRKSPTSSAASCAAYLDVLWIRSTRTFYGALLLVDGRGQPLEFVHNTLTAPAGFLWPEEQVRGLGIATLCHSLFEACRREPELLVCRELLGNPTYCKAEISAAIPFAQVVEAGAGSPAAWNWINDPPTPGMSAHALGETLRTRGFAVEPFTRIHLGLKEVYPQAPWQELQNDPGSSTA